MCIRDRGKRTRKFFGVLFLFSRIRDEFFFNYSGLSNFFGLRSFDSITETGSEVLEIYAPILRNCHRIELYSKHSMLESVLFVEALRPEQHHRRAGFLSTIRGVYFTIVFGILRNVTAFIWPRWSVRAKATLRYMAE